MHIKNIPFHVICSDIDTVDADLKVYTSKNYNQDDIRQTVKDALKEVHAKGYASIAFSDLGCDDAVFPLKGMAKIMVQEIMTYVRFNPDPSLKKIIFCPGNDVSFQIFDKTISGYVRHIQEDMGFGPYTTVDIIIELEGGVVLIERSNPPFGWALPGGFLDYGESLEDAARREAKEETNLDLEDLRQFHSYSDPRRDPRFQTISTVFVAKGKGSPQSGDDAQDLKIVQNEELLNLNFAFDHNQIIEDYKKYGQQQF